MCHMEVESAVDAAASIRETLTPLLNDTIFT